VFVAYVIWYIVIHVFVFEKPYAFLLLLMMMHLEAEGINV
jgi:hypothetical protein